jgi:hypothetical protein
MVHVDKAEKHANLDEGAIDEIIVIGGPEKMPGFFDQFQKLRPNKKITFVTDGELSVGAAIVVQKNTHISRIIFTCFIRLEIIYFKISGS